MDDKALIAAIERIQIRSGKMQMTLWMIGVGFTVMLFGLGLWFQNNKVANFDVVYMIAGLIMVGIGVVAFRFVKSK